MFAGWALPALKASAKLASCHSRGALAVSANAFSVRFATGGGDGPSLVDASGSPVSSRRPKQSNEKLITRFSVDRTGLLGMTPRQKAYTGPPVEKEPMSSLAKELLETAAIKGPMTIAEFMMQCANHSRHGYYHSTDKEKIGPKGDFITSPEVSQVRGHAVPSRAMDMPRILSTDAFVGVLHIY